MYLLKGCGNGLVVMGNYEWLIISFWYGLVDVSILMKRGKV